MSFKDSYDNWQSNQEQKFYSGRKEDNEWHFNLGAALCAWGMFTFIFGAILLCIIEIPGLIIISTSIPFYMLGMRHI